ncbi:IstB ATP binding domain-containing protein [Streptomyces collinus Tu 365]|uniref:IstB ATP binding domain-containing protein n=1 Tax=Streptomyces collinus (strain DSM 40733 / Tue 365) TaxID=1214242 RepID=S5V3C2_STRC3|nr:IstB ATP binding domain-containing protein [Streptomyces collinus Tu 365]
MHTPSWRGALQRLDDNLHRPQLCAAIVDSLTFNGAIIQTGTKSYRFAR